MNNLGEKIMKLRKEAGLSQEELGEKLNVTRQTVSKWELGETTPEINKLTELARIFDVSVDELLNENNETNSKNSDPISEDENKSRSQIVKIILIALLILLVCGIVRSIRQSQIDKENRSMFNKIFNTTSNLVDKALDQVDDVKQESNETDNRINDIYNNTLNKIDQMENDYNSSAKKMKEDYNESVKKMDEEYNQEYDRNSFNIRLEGMQGTKSGFMLSSYLDQVVSSNKKNSDHIVTVSYNGTTTTTEDGIVSIKHSLNDNAKYEVSVDYDSNGYINSVTIKNI